MTPCSLVIPRRGSIAPRVVPALAVTAALCLAGCSQRDGGGSAGGILPTAGTVSISGTWAAGSTLTAETSGFSLGSPAGSYHYVWQRCTDSSCATTSDVGTDAATYTLAASDMGSFVRAGAYVTNTCSSGCGSSEIAYSVPGMVPGTGTLPTEGTVSISGTWAAGSTLSAAPSGFTLGTPPGSYHYSWQRCPDSSCTSTTDVGTDEVTYTLVAADMGSFVRVGVYVTNACAVGCGSSATAFSAASIVSSTGTLPTAGTVSISGSWALRSTLTAVPSGFTLGTPPGSYHYWWERCIDSGCTSTISIGTDAPTYTLTTSDLGSYVRVVAWVVNDCADGCGSSELAISPAMTDPGVLAHWAQWRMPDSATVFCSNGTSQSACPSSGWAFGQDGNYLVNPASYSPTAETVLDDVTGLRWQRFPPDATYTLDEAKAFCAGLLLEGYSGWRVPALIELVSILDLGQVDPKIDPVAFPGALTGQFWSSTSYARNPTGYAWIIAFNGAWIEVNNVSGYPYTRVRCVR